MLRAFQIIQALKLKESFSICNLFVVYISPLSNMGIGHHPSHLMSTRKWRSPNNWAPRYRGWLRSIPQLYPKRMDHANRWCTVVM